MALRTAAAETAGTVVSDVVEITATDADGERLTSFPAELHEVPDDESADGPPVYDVTPGIALTLAVDAARVAEAALIPRRCRSTPVPTREPWSLLPSYFDAETGTVRGESDHLSQFVVIGIPFVPAPGPRIVLDPDNDEGSVQTPAPASEFPVQLGPRRPPARDARGPVPRSGDRDATRGRALCLARHPGTGGRGGEARCDRGLRFQHVPRLRVGHRAGGRDAGVLAGTRRRQRSGAVVRRPDAGVHRASGRSGRHPPGTSLSRSTRTCRARTRTSRRCTSTTTSPAGDRSRVRQHRGRGVPLSRGYLETQGFDCSDPATGGWPSPPSQAELARWRNLGYQNPPDLRRRPGVVFRPGTWWSRSRCSRSAGRVRAGDRGDPRLQRAGRSPFAGGGGVVVQPRRTGATLLRRVRVLTVRGDGASDVFTPDGAGGYTSADDPDLTLVEAGGGASAPRRP